MPRNAEIKDEIRNRVLIEALPYIDDFYGKTMVVKVGGHALDDEDLFQALADDLVLLHRVGIKIIVVHGGGPQINDLLKQVGKVPKRHKRTGLRITDEETLTYSGMALTDINSRIVRTINAHGALASGLTGLDGSLIQAKRLDEEHGFVGTIERVNPKVLNTLLNDGFIPVVAPMGVDSEQQNWNVNADDVAAAIGVSMDALKVIFLTDEDGINLVKDDPSTKLTNLTSAELRAHVIAGDVPGPLMPKVESMLSITAAGTAAHVIDGRVPHVLLQELLTQAGKGTMVRPNPDQTRAIELD